MNVANLFDPTANRIANDAVQSLIDLEEDVFGDHCLPGRLRAIVVVAMLAAIAAHSASQSEP